MQHTPTTTFKIVFAVNKIKYVFKKILLEKNIKKFKKIPEFHTDFKSIKKDVKNAPKKLLDEQI
jgi:hypothetical protein